MFHVLRGLMRRFSGGFLISASLSATDLVSLIKKIDTQNQVRDWSLLIPGTGAEGNIIFSPKNS